MPKEDDDKTTSEENAQDTGNEDEKNTSTEEDDSEDNETSESEDGDESSTEDEDGDEEDTISQKYFADPNSIPKELRAPFKKMQGIFTRKMQQASISIKKAEAFDQLVTDPEFRDWMEERVEKLKGSGKGTSKKNSKETNEEDEDDKPLTRKEFREMMNRQNKQKADEEHEIEFKAFTKKNPDYKFYEADMKERLDRNPNLTFQEAYDLASKEDRKTSRTKEDMTSKKNANSLKPKGATKEPEKKKGKMTFQEAFDLAKKTVGLGKK